MSILIKGINIPKNEQKLYIITFSDGKACASCNPFEWHEVIEVPNHGGLIDVNMLEQECQKRLLECRKYNNQFQEPYEIMRAIELAPIVIPKEE